MIPLGFIILAVILVVVRRVVAAAAAVAFLIGVSAAAALRTPEVLHWPSLWGPGTEKMGADPNRPHEYETLMVDDEGHANPAWMNLPPSES